MSVKADCLSLVAQAERAKGNEDYWRGVKVAALVILKGNAWHVCTATEKRRIDPEREAKERSARNASAKSRRAVKMAKLAHLHNYFKDSISGDEWKRYGGTPECDSKRALAWDKRDAWPETNRLVMDPAEATCRECLDAAIEKKIPGAEEQLRKLWRKDEAEMMEGK